MVSDKRFELILIKYNDENDVDESWWAIKDNETDKTMQDVETVELLNELTEENEQLKERVMVLEKLISDVETSEGMSIDNLIDTEMIGDE